VRAWRTTISTDARTSSSPNDAGYGFLFHNLGSKFEEVAFDARVALAEDGNFISGMGLDIRDFNSDGYPDIAYVALNNQTFSLYENTDKGDLREATTPSGMREPACLWQATARVFTISTTMDEGSLCRSWPRRIHGDSRRGYRSVLHGLSKSRQDRQVDSADCRSGTHRRSRSGIVAALLEISMGPAALMWWRPRWERTQRSG